MEKVDRQIIKRKCVYDTLYYRKMKKRSNSDKEAPYCQVKDTN